MALMDMVRRPGRRPPLRIVMHGPEGIGKTTWAAGAPAPIFLGVEDGYGDLPVDRLPTPTTWGHITDAVRLLAADKHDYRTLVIDTIDHAERLAWEDVCSEHKITSIEALPYGKGYLAAYERFVRLTHALDSLRTARGMSIILLAHTATVTVKNPEGPDYDKASLKLHKATSAFVREWCDVMLYAHHDVEIRTSERGDRALLSRGKIKDSSRVVETAASPAYDAKTRYALPETLPMRWAAFADALAASAPATATTTSTGQTIEQRRASAIGALGKRGVPLPVLEARIGAPADSWDSVQLEALKADFVALRDGVTSAAEYIAAHTPPDPEPAEDPGLDGADLDAWGDAPPDPPPDMPKKKAAAGVPV